MGKALSFGFVVLVVALSSVSFTEALTSVEAAVCKKPLPPIVLKPHCLHPCCVQYNPCQCGDCKPGYYLTPPPQLPKCAKCPYMGCPFKHCICCDPFKPKCKECRKGYMPMNGYHIVNGKSVFHQKAFGCTCKNNFHACWLMHPNGDCVKCKKGYFLKNGCCVKIIVKPIDVKFPNLQVATGSG